MSPEPESRSRRRILLAFDHSHRGRSAAETAVQLAAILEAELAGLFIEDENLLRTAGLPFAHELGLFSRKPRPMDRASVEHSLRREARDMEDLLRSLSEPVQVRFTFHVSRGLVPSELVRHHAPGDVLVFGKTPRLRPHPRVRPGARRHVRTSLITVFFDAQEEARPALRLAVDLARETKSSLLLITPPNILPPVVPDGITTEHAIASDFLHILAQGLAHHASMLILPDGGRIVDVDFMARLANEIDIPVLLV